MRTALGVAGAPGLTRTLAAGYHGPPELTVTRALTEWTLDPWMLALIVLLGGAYLAGVRRVRDTGSWPAARPIWFCGLGLGFLLIATMSWVGVYQSVLMYPRAVQTVLLVLVVPLFLALGRPLTLFAAVFPRAGARLEAVIRCRPVRILTFPAITTFVLVAVPFVMYFTSWYTAVFHSTTLRELTYLVLMVPGYVFFWTLLRVDPVPKEYSYAVSMWITGAEVIGDAFFGIAVIADQNLIGAGYFHALARPWGPTLGHDCQTNAETIRTLLGYMPEHDCLPPDVTATEFVTHLGRMSGLPPTVAKERAAESLRHVGLHEERYRLIGTYSTGMKQRVKLAQALVGDPRLLLLDEPTNGLDPAGRTAMLELIARIGAEFGISIMVASHLLGEIERICDHLVAIEAGRLLRADTITSFTQASQVLAVEVEEGLAQLQQELQARGLAATRAQRTLLVPLGGDDTYDVVRDAVADLALALCRLEQRRHQVEELFRDEESQEHV